jgi:hypothetical protein
MRCCPVAVSVLGRQADLAWSGEQVTGRAPGAAPEWAVRLHQGTNLADGAVPDPHQTVLV